MITDPDFVNNLLNSPVDAATPGFFAATKVRKDGYSTLVSHRNLGTYSTLEIFHACPRKFSIKKMEAAVSLVERQGSVTFAFGHAVGAGVAVYDQTQSIDDALWAAFLAWDQDFLASETKAGHTGGRSFWEVGWALYQYVEFYENETDLRDYETAHIEATIGVDFENGHFYSGHVDEVLRNKYTGSYRIKENKTSGFKNIHPALYSNSDQALSYAVVIDALGATEYEVLYTIYSVPERKWVQFPFVKSALKKIEWLQAQLCVHTQIDQYTELAFFPKRGSACFQYMRPCEYYEDCDHTFDVRYGMGFGELPAIQSLDDIHAIEPIDFRASLTDLINRQKESL
jgi:hypothetical protein